MSQVEQPLSARQFHRILIVKPSSLGDVLHGLPVLHFLRERFPDAELHWMVSRPLAPLIEGQPGIDRLVLFDRKELGRAGRSVAATRRLFGFIRALRGQAYDLVVDLQGLFRSALFARCSGAPVRVGFRQTREFAWCWYSHFIPVQDSSMHAVDRNRDVGRLFQKDAATARFNYRVLPEAAATARARLDQFGLSAKAYFALVPGARWETKMWDASKFADVALRLQERTGMRSLLLGGPEDRKRCEIIAKAASGAAVNLAGETTLPVLAALLAEARHVVCHDSGAMHLAVALDRPVTCIVGPTNADRTGPYGRSDDVVRLPLSCSPCYLRKLSQCPHDHACMRDLPSEAVFEAVCAREAGQVGAQGC